MDSTLGWNVGQSSYNVEQLLTLDLRKLERKEDRCLVDGLVEALAQRKTLQLPGPLVLQVLKMVDVAQPSTHQSERTEKRLLQLTATDGSSLRASCLECPGHLSGINSKQRLGFKILVNELRCERGFLCLDDTCARVIGGYVANLGQGQALKEEVSNLREAKLDTGAPPFVPLPSASMTQGRVEKPSQNNFHKSGQEGKIAHAKNDNGKRDKGPSRDGKREHKDQKGKKDKTGPCRRGAACTKPGCKYSHPPKEAPKKKDLTGPCRYGANCTKPDCKYWHPAPPSAEAAPKEEKKLSKDKAGICRRGVACTKPGCKYSHPAPAGVANKPEGTAKPDDAPNINTATPSSKCHRGANCTKQGCRYAHPEGHGLGGASLSSSKPAPKACFNGAACKKPGCKYSHG